MFYFDLVGGVLYCYLPIHHANHPTDQRVNLTRGMARDSVLPDS